MKILILNGPNLNLVGTREPEVYGAKPMEQIVAEVGEAFPEHEFVYAQSNCEGTLIDLLQEARTEHMDGIVLNAGAYTHTSIALRDAIAAIQPIPVVEVHLSNVHRREEFRHRSMISAVCLGVVAGFGELSYRLAAEALIHAQRPALA